MPHKCDSCGRFVADKELCLDGGASFAFVPDTPHGPEENYLHCKKCTDHPDIGPPKTNQRTTSAGVF